MPRLRTTNYPCPGKEKYPRIRKGGIHMPESQSITFHPLAKGRFRGTDGLLYTARAVRSHRSQRQRAAKPKVSPVPEAQTPSPPLNAIPNFMGDINCPHCGALFTRTEYKIGQLQQCWDTDCKQQFMPALK
jgi:hypothetical protein